MDQQTPAPYVSTAGTSPEQELEHGSRARREADWRLGMDERLTRLNELCKQMTAIVGAAKRRA
ncbi:MAG: hypothetical protein M3Y17_14345 [Actinomycetota bacterium]|nr:hypothetical protein [Actinomycetota bacterium]